MNDIVPIGKDLTEYEYAPDKLQLLKDTVAKGQDLSDAEFMLMGYVAKQAGLDPFLKQLYPIKFTQGSTGKKVLNFITSIDGYRLIAERTGKYAGRDDYMFNEGLSLYQMLNEKEDGKKIVLQTATCTVYKIVQGVRCPTCTSVRWKEYYPTNKFKQFMWNQRPFGMLGKCSESQSLRAAFPNNYKGIYLDAEFDQSEADPAYQPEDTEDLIKEAIGLYDMLGYNLAKTIQTNMKHIGTTDLYSAHKEQLEMLIYFLKGEVEKANQEEK